MTLNVGDLVGGVSLDCSQFVCVVSLDAGDFVILRAFYYRVRTVVSWFIVQFVL